MSNSRVSNLQPSLPHNVVCRHLTPDQKFWFIKYRNELVFLVLHSKLSLTKLAFKNGSTTFFQTKARMFHEQHIQHQALFCCILCIHVNRTWMQCHISILIRKWNMASRKWKSGNESRNFNDCRSKYFFNETAGLSYLSEKHFCKERIYNIQQHYEKKHKQIGKMKYVNLKFLWSVNKRNVRNETVIMNCYANYVVANITGRDWWGKKGGRPYTDSKSGSTICQL